MRLLAVVSAVLLIAMGEAQAQPGRDEPFRNISPEQREYLWQSMTPQQRAEFWHRLTPEQRQSIRNQMTPEQREVIRQRMMEERGRRMEAGPPGPAMGLAAEAGPGQGPRRLSPEERQRLREQIQESTRDLRNAPQAERWMQRRMERQGRGGR
jgi:hypothetical protein